MNWPWVRPVTRRAHPLGQCRALLAGEQGDWDRAGARNILLEQLVQQGLVWGLHVLGDKLSLQPSILPSHLCFIGFNPHTQIAL